ncbi:MAG: hypothetical protein QOE14_473, partial [Humisphaera sp.]|nr:hypothetical protein [Humisphaera sp.]
MGAFTFTKFADPADPIPGAPALQWFDFPYFDGTTAAFTGGVGTTLKGLYARSGSAPVRTIADFSTVLPEIRGGGGGGTLTSISNTCTDGGRVAFAAERQAPDGSKRTTIYLDDNGKILPLVDENAPLPKSSDSGAGGIGGAGASGTLANINFTDFSLSGDRVAFTSSSYDKAKQKGEWGIFTASVDGKIRRVIDHRAAVPGFAGLKFGMFSNLRLTGETVTFQSQGGQPNKLALVIGIYQAGPKSCVRVVDTQMPVPGRPELRFRGIDLQDTDGADVIFRAMFLPREAKLWDRPKDRSAGWAGLY